MSKLKLGGKALSFNFNEILEMSVSDTLTSKGIMVHAFLGNLEMLSDSSLL